MNKHINYFKKNFDDAAIIGVLTKIILSDINELNLTDNELKIVDAFRRSTNELQDADINEISDYLHGMDENQIIGIVNNTKGILHEIEYVDMENSDLDSIRAELFSETNHPGYDVILTDTRSGDIEDIQLKATDDFNQVNSWIDDHPDGRIAVTSELADKMGIESTGMSDHGLTVRVEDFVDKIQDLGDNDSIWSYIPMLSVASVSIVIFELHRRYKNNLISKAQFKRQVALVTGKKVLKFTFIACLMAIPVVNVATGAILIARMLISADNTFSRKNHFRRSE